MTNPDTKLVERIAAEARRRSGAQREAFLEDTCGTDIALRERVEKLLQPRPLGTLVPGTEATLTHVASDVPSKHSIHPRNRLSRLLPTTNIIVHIWASHLYRTIAIAVFVALIVLLGLGSRYLVWNELHKLRQQEFEALLTAEVQALTLWIDSCKSQAELVARDPEVVAAIDSLLKKHAELKEKYSSADIQPELEILREHLPEFNKTEEETQAFVQKNDPITLYVYDPNAPGGQNSTFRAESITEDDEGAYIIADTFGFILASNQEARIGSSLKQQLDPRVAYDIMNGNTGFLPPNRSDASQDQTDRATYVWAYTPIREEGESPRAMLGLGYFSVGNFTRALTNIRTGATGEAYAFDEKGRMLTESRFTKDLWQRDVLSEGTPTRANLLLAPSYGPTSHEPSNPRHGHFTRLVSMARDGQTEDDDFGVILEPYKGYTGHDVVGAWLWLDDYHFGVAYETAAYEAFSPFTYISIGQYVLLGLIAAFAGITYFAANSMVMMRRSIGDNMIVGSYILLRKIGEGGMGQVYLARHQMLKRPTAVKLVRPDKTDPGIIKRFEREVQLSSRLKHPNTVEIYDYGKTPEDVFYYAMEYLDGVTLEELVRQNGWQAVPRVLYVMRQVAASLREAHAMGLIHRDIKPLNIMLCRVGGEYDVAKVLDFGLVKNLSADPGATVVTRTTEISGTPMYIPPERVKNPTQADPRVDIYALGATAFFMLTGRTIHLANSAVDVLVQIVTQPVPSVHEAADRIIPEPLQDLLDRCLAKDPAQRPQTAEEVIREVEAMLAEHPWSTQEAQTWWESHVPANTLATWAETAYET
ncbi:serine/threonine protein kinase [Blastopirellula marina]|nr:serine/threonine-protein kinase [Blastopirellula marina]